MTTFVKQRKSALCSVKEAKVEVVEGASVSCFLETCAGYVPGLAELE
jgi:hypothetical protein